MKRLRVGLNGFGRIGRSFARISFEKDLFDIVLINTRKTQSDMLAYLLKYDTVYGRFKKEIKFEKDSLIIDNKKVKTNLSDSIENIPWDKENIDVVVDATGAFKKSEELKKHIKGSVKKVILTAPSKDDETPHLVLGVNDKNFDFTNSTIISNCSCTTNCAAVMFKVLDDLSKVKSGFLTTVHAYTSSQALIDDAGKDFSKSRAAALNIVPSTTGASKAIAKVLPQLSGKVEGMALRVPVPTVSFTDISCFIERETTIEEINKLFKEQSQSNLKSILGYEENSLVSSDFIGSEYSCIFDANHTKIIDKNFVKITGWYDNEWGYSARLVDLVAKLAEYIKN